MNTDARYIIWLLDFLSSKGVDVQALCARHQLPDLESLDVSISSATHRDLLADALFLTGDTGLGLKLGYQRSLATYDQLAYLMMSCSTLREATEKGLKYPISSMHRLDWILSMVPVVQIPCMAMVMMTSYMAKPVTIRLSVVKATIF